MSYQYRIDKERRRWFIFQPFLQKVPKVTDRNSGEEYFAGDLNLEGLANAVIDIYEGLPLKDDLRELNMIQFYSKRNDYETKTILRFCDYLEEQRKKMNSLDNVIQRKEDKINRAFEVLD